MGNHLIPNNLELKPSSSPVAKKSIINSNKLDQNEKKLINLEYIIEGAIGINPNNILNIKNKDIIKQRIINSPNKIRILNGLNNLEFCPTWGIYIFEIIKESIQSLDKDIIAKNIYDKIQLKTLNNKIKKNKEEIKEIKEILFNEENFKRNGKSCNLGILKGIETIEKKYNITFSDKEKNIFFQDVVKHKSNIAALNFSEYIKKEGLPNPPIIKHKLFSPDNKINANYLTYIISDKSLENTDFKSKANLYLISIRQRNNARKISSHNISLATKLSSYENIKSEEIILELNKINNLKYGLDFLESGEINIDYSNKKISTRDAIKEVLINNNIDKNLLFENGKSVYFILSELKYTEREELLNILKTKGKENKDYLKIYNIVLSLDILDKELDKRQELAKRGYSIEDINKEFKSTRRNNNTNNSNAFIAIQTVINSNEYISTLKDNGFEEKDINIIYIGNNLYNVNIGGADFGICDSSKKEVTNVIDTAKFLKKLGVSFLFPYIDLILYELKINASSNIGGLKLDIKNGLDIYEKAYLFRIISKLIFGNENNELSNILDEDSLNVAYMQSKISQYAQENYHYTNNNNNSLDYRFIAGKIENERLQKYNQKDIWINENGSTVNVIALLKRIRELNIITR